MKKKITKWYKRRRKKRAEQTQTNTAFDLKRAVQEIRPVSVFPCDGPVYFLNHLFQVQIKSRQTSTDSIHSANSHSNKTNNRKHTHTQTESGFIFVDKYSGGKNCINKWHLFPHATSGWCYCSLRAAESVSLISSAGSQRRIIPLF